MTTRTLAIGWCLAAIVAICGCSDSSKQPPASGSATPSASITPPSPATPPVPAQAGPPAEPTLPAAPAPAAPAVPPAPPVPSASAAADAASQLLKYAQAQADPLLSSLSQELGAKVASLSQSLSGDPALRGSLTNAVLSVVGGKDTEAMSLVQKLTQAKLTPEQMGLAKQVRDVTSAFLVQKNLASLDGAQTEVGQIVNSLRKGETAAALPAIQKVAMNAKLTPAQKDFVTTLADQYAPGLKSATDALQKGLDGLKSFGK